MPSCARNAAAFALVASSAVAQACTLLASTSDLSGAEDTADAMPDASLLDTGTDGPPAATTDADAGALEASSFCALQTDAAFCEDFDPAIHPPWLLRGDAATLTIDPTASVSPTSSLFLPGGATPRVAYIEQSVSSTASHAVLDFDLKAPSSIERTLQMFVVRFKGATGVENYDLAVRLEPTDMSFLEALYYSDGGVRPGKFTTIPRPPFDKWVHFTVAVALNGSATATVYADGVFLEMASLSPPSGSTSIALQIGAQYEFNNGSAGVPVHFDNVVFRISP